MEAGTSPPMPGAAWLQWNCLEADTVLLCSSGSIAAISGRKALRAEDPQGTGIMTCLLLMGYGMPGSRCLLLITAHGPMQRSSQLATLVQ